MQAFADGKRPVGLVAGGGEQRELDVTDDMAATRVGSGDVAVLASPALVALIERAAVHYLRRRLPPDLTTVGASFVLTHEAPTPIGAPIRVTVSLEGGDSKKLLFTFVAEDGSGRVASGSHVRVIVHRARFEAAAQRRSRRLPPAEYG